MKNKERYPNTDDALKAFAEHNKHCKCGCTFEQWLDKDRTPLEKDVPFILGALIASTVVDALKTEMPKEKTKSDKPDGEWTGIECPVCHGKNGKIGGLLLPSFVCEDCGTLLGHKTPTPESYSEFKAFIDGLATKNSKKN